MNYCKRQYRNMMVPQQDTGVKPPDGSMNGKVAKQKGGLGGTNLTAPNGGGTAEQQAQRCPRCDSLNTKFCYYNNYSLSQPRHFCKNCRRYWTKGGALRNVPVGGGCRKNKRLKHRDPSCLAALAEMDASGSSNILASISGCGLPGFGPSTSSLIQDLANEGHRQLALSRLAGMQVFDKRFMAENEHNHQGGVSTQDLFTLGAGSGPATALLGPFDPSSYPALNYTKSDSQPLLFHPHHTSHELTPFFDHISATSPILTPTMDHLSTFTSTATAPISHHVSANSMGNSGAMDSQLSLIHHNICMNGMPASHEIHSHEDQQQRGQGRAIGGGFSEESVEMSMAKSKGKSLISSLSDWTAGTPQQATTTNTEILYNFPPQANDSSLWNVSWPEMHAALAGSAAAAGAMLH